MALAISSVFTPTNKGGVNGATVTGFLASRLSYQLPPEYTLPPDSPDIGPVTTSNLFGSTGSWSLTATTEDQYYIAVYWNYRYYWFDSYYLDTYQASEITEGAGGGPATFGRWFYGDGFDGPLLFTATPRTITDGVTTPGSLTLTSVTADFTDADVGLVVDDNGAGGLASIIPGTRIAGILGPTVAFMTNPASSTGGGSNTVLIGAEILVPGSYSSVTIPTGATARPYTPSSGGYGATLCQGEFYIDGTLDLSGVGTTQNAGSTTAGSNASAPWAPLSGAGGAGSTVTTGDTPGGISSPASPNSIETQPLNALNLYNIGVVTAGAPPGKSFAYGASGGGDGVNNGGDGGNAGIGWCIAASSIVHGAHASYTLTGQAGTDGAGGNAGGGGGGADGWWLTFSDSLSGSPALVGGGGLGGAGKGTGTDGARGAPGFGIHYTPSTYVRQTPS